MEDSANIYYVFAVHPGEEDEPQHQLLGKFWLHDGNFTILEDHGMAPDKDLSKMPPQAAARLIGRMASSQRRIVASAKQLAEGECPELLANEGSESLPRGLKDAITRNIKGSDPEVSSYEYHREGMPGPQTLKLAGEQMWLDDQPVAPEETDKILENINTGKATLRHQLSKSEDLLKIEPHLADALGGVRAAVAAGHVHPAALKELTRHLFKDTQCPTMGNLVAYRDFQSRPRAGVHIHIDMNGLRALNNDLGHDAGNQAIAAHGRALRTAMDEAVGRSSGKLFHVHGDEFVAHVPTHEHAARFARAVRSKLDAIPAIRGTHRLSTSMGWGPTSDHAEAALLDAKAAKNSMKYAPGQARTHAASRMPGQEAPMPVE
jgi:GGDEF domain-containing protein